MISLEDLSEIYPVYCYPKGYTVSFEALIALVSNPAREFGVPIAFAPEKIISGNIPELIIEDCLVIYHPEQSDYLKFVFRIVRENGTAYIYKYSYKKALSLKPSHVLNAGNGYKAANKKAVTEKNYCTALKAIFKYIMC